MQGQASGSPLTLLLPRAHRAMKKRYLVLALLSAALVLLIVGLCLWLPSSSRPPTHVYARAAVAADAKHCSEIGR